MAPYPINQEMLKNVNTVSLEQNAEKARIMRWLVLRRRLFFVLLLSERKCKWV
jgi:hypothetical protein